MKLPRKSTSLYILGFVVFLLVFAYLELTFTRRVESTSMLPTLEPGDLVVIQHVAFSDLKVGDIIVYDPPCSATGSSVIHRIVNLSGNGVITMGDNNPYNDIGGGISTGPVTANCFVGKVVFVIPYVERIASLPFGANYIIAALIFVAIIYLWLVESDADHGTKNLDGKVQTKQFVNDVSPPKSQPDTVGRVSRLLDKILFSTIYTLYIPTGIGHFTCLKRKQL